MKIVVCMKVIAGERNPFDESALEMALSLSRDVTVLCMGPRSAQDALLPLTRLGAKVILLSDPAFAGSDTLATAYILSCALQKMEYDLVLCGRQTIDGDTAQVGPEIAANLGIGCITNVLSFAVCGGVANATSRFGEESVALPALLTVERGRYLRFPSIFSRVGEVTVRSNADLQCDAQRCGLEGSPTRVLSVKESESGRRQCQWITMDRLEPLLSDLLAQTKQTQRQLPSFAKKMPRCAVVAGESQTGVEELTAWANAIAEEVTRLEETDPAALAERLRSFEGAVLWNADLWGRRVAPAVAAKLQTGLCADCTALDTDGERLFMIRPAKSGSIEARIQCKTEPQMATVRTTTQSADFLIGAGRGVCTQAQIERLQALAKRFDATLCASRAAVDTGLFPYESQVGLTGKTVCPQIYLAVGVSGAVHHTCAMERSGTVIAINPDRNARIFEYADYGIVAEF